MKRLIPLFLLLSCRTSSTVAPLSAVPAPIPNLGGWTAQTMPQNRSTKIAASRDGKTVAITWTHNDDSANKYTGEPTAYVRVVNPHNLSAAPSPTLFAVRPFPYDKNVTVERKEYNVKHNTGLVIPTTTGFLALGLPMSANGYAEGLAMTDKHFITSAYEGSWQPRAFAVARNLNGISVSEPSGGTDDAGNLHLFGQGQLGRDGAFDGGFGHIYRSAGNKLWDAQAIAAPYRPTGMNYFVEGEGIVTSKGSLHTVFTWNKQGAFPTYGVYYLRSADGGKTWKNAAGSVVTLPLRMGVNDSEAQIRPAGLTSSSYSGRFPGANHVECVGATPDGNGVVVKGEFIDAEQTKIQARAFVWNSKWYVVNVGPEMFWNSAGCGVALNSKTGNVNVLLLDPGSVATPGRLLLYTQSLADLRNGLGKWTQTLVTSFANTRNYTSSLQAVLIPDTRFLVIVEPNYANPARVAPLYVEVPLL